MTPHQPLAGIFFCAILVRLEKQGFMHGFETRGVVKGSSYQAVKQDYQMSMLEELARVTKMRVCAY